MSRTRLSFSTITWQKSQKKSSIYKTSAFAYIFCLIVRISSNFEIKILELIPSYPLQHCLRLYFCPDPGADLGPVS